MPERFDPLYEWLGIPPKDQPPNHYRLLGIELFESNLNVIERAADRQMSHVRTFQTGKNGRHSQELLNKLSAAKVCLLQPRKKAEYDEQLRSEIAPHDSVSAMEIPADLSSLMPKALAPISMSAPAIPVSVVNEVVTVVEKPRRKLQKSSNTALVIGLSAVFITIVGGVVLWLMLTTARSKPNSSPATSVPSTPPVVTPSPASATTHPTTPGGNSTKPTGSEPSTPAPTTVAGSAGSTSEGATARTNPPALNSPNPSDNKKPPDSVPAIATPSPPIRAPVEMPAYNEVDQPPQEPTPLDPLPPPEELIVSRFGNAQGLINNELAYCQTMPYDDFRVYVSKLRETFYRPIRVRPYVMNGMALIAAVWTRDTIPWRVVSGVSRSELQNAHSTLEREGYFLVDVAGFDESGEEFTAVWAKTSAPVPSRLLVGVSAEQFEQELRSSNNSGFVLRSAWRYRDKNDGVRVCAAFLRPSPKPAWFSFAGTNSFFASQLTKGLPIDVSHFPAKNGTRMAGIILTDDKRPYSITHSGTVDEHQQKCAEFVSQGLRPLSISVIQRAEDKLLEGASIWVAKETGVFPEFKDGITAPTVTGVRPATTIPTPAATQNLPEKPSAPPKEAIDAAVAKSREVLKQRFAAFNTPLRQVPFSAELLASAREESEPRTKYSLFLLARDVAIDAGDPWAAERALDGIETSFDTDIWPIRTEMIDKINPKLRTDVARRALAEVSLLYFQRALAEEQFDLAEKFLAPARRFKDLARAVSARSKSLGPMRKLAESAAQAEMQLEQTPNDAEAHLTLGRFLCFAKGDWPQGLVHLSQGSDASLADLAKQDLSHPADAATKAQVAAGWATWASDNAGDENMAAWQRAQWWLTSSASDPTRGGPIPKPSEIEQKIAARLAEFGDLRPHWRGYDQPLGEVMRFDGHAEAVRSIAVARSGRWLVSGSRDDTVRVWDLTTGVEVSRMPNPLDNFMSLALLPDEQTVLLSGIENKVVSVNLVTRTETGRFDIENSMRKMVVSADGRRMLQWRGVSPRTLITSEINGAKPVVLPTQNALTAIDLGRSGTIAACSQTNDIFVWDLRKPAAPMTLTGFSGFVSDLAISPNEQLIAACYNEGLVVWDLQSRQETLRIALPRGGVRVAFSLDSRRLVTSTSSNNITLVNAANGTVVKTLNSTTDNSVGSCEAIAMLPDGRGAVTAGADGSIHVWRLPD